jgi:hypothetical protein
MRLGLGIAWPVLLGFLLCAGAAFGMKKGVGRTLVLIFIPALAIPLEILLMGLLLVWLSGLKGVQ